ncbi:MAG: serine/threonine-protein kinase, partial [Polyangiaceae bacterium]
MGLAELRPRREAVRERLGRVLDGRFRLEACLGAGGTGAVYRARTLAVAVVEGEGPRLPAPPLPPVVAVKILHPDLVADAARRELFLKEARIAALVDHPGVVKVFDARVAADGTAYLVLELIAGKCLETAIVGWGDLLVDEVVRVTRGILEILAVAHEAGVVHCDVKPENVLVMDDGSVKLLDFGVARIT